MDLIHAVEGLNRELRLRGHAKHAHHWAGDDAPSVGVAPHDQALADGGLGGEHPLVGNDSIGTDTP